MNRKNEKQLVVGLDIGTSKVVAIVGEFVPGEPVEVIGIGSHVSRGLKRGTVVDIESTVHSIQRAVEEAELMAGCDIRSVFASISGSHLETKNSHGTAAIRDREVTAADLEQVLEAARAVAIPADRKVLYKEPQEYRIDGQDGIRHPVGMSGVRLEASVHLVTGAAPAVHNITKCISRCGLSVDELVPSAVASAKAVLTDDERELGVCLVDIGAGTTDIAIYTQGAIRYTKSLPVGGDQVTSDIAYGVHTPTAHAEEIKIKYACALAQLARAEETIQVPSVGDRPPRRLARQALAQSVQARYEEIFEMVQDELRRSGFESMVAAGVVLTGGASRMEGALELAEEVFHKMVRLGHPTQVSGFGDVIGNPSQASGVGLLLHGARSGGSGIGGGPIGPGMGGMIGKMRDWLTRNF
ncbi:cell division protein FtsA [Oleiagrimonas sp.]|jgi:cell division protein FtsA|uniref:cell division protein FtsA n=1 Tax=Oleiagrimonas sp. TaxID=2010330 RepID=UPI00260B1161|nr:cell division protein FtsA [Oleiagrimonas sp.]MDA3915207.1 cell division protein FtsA [Oleiagrimonas sp.]